MLVLILLIIVGSLIGFTNREFFERGVLSVRSFFREREYYRLISVAFLHADAFHLIFNVIALYSFGSAIANEFGQLTSIIIFTFALFVSSVVSIIIYRADFSYRAVGASGGAMGVVFTYVILAPASRVLVLFFPMPAWLFGILFIGYSFFGARNRLGNIGHSAHLAGSLTGILCGLIIRIM